MSDDVAAQQVDPSADTVFVSAERADETSALPGPLARLTKADLSTLRWWLITRIAVLIAVGASAWLLTSGKGKPSGIFARWVQWDAVNFNVIAQFGYAGDGSRKAPYFEAFFPGFPLTLRPLVNLGVPVGLAGLLVSATALAVAVVALRRLGDLEAGTVGVWLSTAVTGPTTFRC